MILVTGANGHLGSATIDFLLAKKPGIHIKGLVRSEEKGETLRAKGVEIAIGDYTDYDALVRATQGVETLLLISASSPTNRYQQHANVIQAAKANGVQHIVYTSILKASADSKFSAAIDHVETEKELQASGIDYTIMRNTYYADFLLMIIGNALETGSFFYNAGHGKANFAARNEMAEANAAVLLNPAAHRNKVYEITAASTYSFDEIAAMLSEMTGKSVQYVDISDDVLKENMLKAGLPEEVAKMMVSIGVSIREGQFDVVDPALETLIGRKPMDLKDFFRNTGL